MQNKIITKVGCNLLKPEDSIKLPIASAEFCREEQLLCFEVVEGGVIILGPGSDYQDLTRTEPLLVLAI